MPVTREGRFMYASREELSGYLGREAGLDVPVHIGQKLDLSRCCDHVWSFRQYNSRNREPLFVPGGSAMRILVPWKQSSRILAR